MINEIFGVIFISIAVLMYFFALLGIYRFKYVLNRLHAAGIADTLGILFLVIGILCLTGITMTTLKLLLVVVFMWITSPIQSHYIARVERMTNSEYKEKIRGRK